MSSLSIITVTCNVAETLPDCLASIGHQSVVPQHVVVDGASTDGTLAVLQNRGLKDMKMISESDDGIYFAMNKGLHMADNEIIGILNGDDEYAHADVLARVEEVFQDPGVDGCYGDLVYVDRDNSSKILRNWCSGKYNIRKFYWGWMVPHPTLFVRKRVYEQFGGFNTELGSAADYELMLRFMVRHRIQVKYIPEVLIKMRTGGVSNSSLANRLRANRMDRKAWKINKLKPYPWTVSTKPIRKLPQWFLKNQVV